jgi:putative Ig domain-containing protein
VQVGQAYSFTPTASSPRGGALSFSIANMPTWAAFNTTTGQLSGTPATANVGSFANISISVSDGTGTASLPPFTISVTAATPPSIGGSPPTTVQVGQAYSFTPTASSPRGASLTFSITNEPLWATFNSATGQLAGTPAGINIGSFTSISISVSDGTATASLAPFTISVTAATLPTISGSPPTTAQVGQAYSFTPTASSPRGAALSFSIANMPTWAAFNTTTGQLSGTPATANVGSFANISISVSDGTATASLAPFTIAVTAATPPTISGSPPTSAQAGQAYSFTPTASSPRGAALTFSIINMPIWTSFSTLTGQLWGTPTNSNVGSFANITISVSDGTAAASLPAFAISVAAVAPPTISGAPPTTVIAGQTYTFTPTASSPRGAPLTFSIANMPAWASFSTSTGKLSGTPSTANVGTYANVLITVSDGTASASLASFTIAVQTGTTGTATLTWAPPTTRTDGTALTNLAGFHLYYGTASGTHPNMITATNPALTTYVVANLPGGATYYFVATAYDANGTESAPTNEVSKAIP